MNETPQDGGDEIKLNKNERNGSSAMNIEYMTQKDMNLSDKDTLTAVKCYTLICGIKECVPVYLRVAWSYHAG